MSSLIGRRVDAAGRPSSRAAVVLGNQLQRLAEDADVEPVFGGLFGVPRS